jgi:hypothetical protein
MTTQARTILFADFVEETLAAVNRAIELRSNDDKIRTPTVTIGLVYDGDKDKTGSIFGWPDFDPADLQLLKTRKPLNTESVNELTDLLQRDYRRYGIPFASALGQDFGRTMDTLFGLTPEQRDAFYELSKVGSDSLKAVSKMLIAVFNMNTDDLHLDLVISPPKKTQAAAISKFKPEIKLEFKTGPLTDPKPEIVLSFTWKL